MRTHDSKGKRPSKAKRGEDRGICCRPSRGTSIRRWMFDCATITLALRNVTDPKLVFQEMNRVVRPGGSVVSLDFSRPNVMFRPFYYFHIFCILPLIGRLHLQEMDGNIRLPSEFDQEVAVAHEHWGSDANGRSFTRHHTPTLSGNSHTRERHKGLAEYPSKH